MVNDPYGEADRMNEVNKEMVNDLFFRFMSDGVCNSSRSVDWDDGAAWELAHKDAQAHKATRARRAANGRGVL